MTELVEDLLLLARLDAGRELAHEEVDLAALAVDAVADAHVAGPEHALAAGRRARTTGADDCRPTPTTVLGDDHRLHQVLATCWPTRACTPRPARP